MNLRISIPDIMWSDIAFAPKDGRIIYAADEDGNVDLIKWCNGEWTAELGSCFKISKWAPVTIANT